MLLVLSRFDGGGAGLGFVVQVPRASCNALQSRVIGHVLKKLGHLVETRNELLGLHGQQPVVRGVMLTVLLGQGCLVTELAEDFAPDQRTAKLQRLV